MFKTLNQNAVNLRPFTVYKNWEYNHITLISKYAKKYLTGNITDANLLYSTIKTKFYNSVELDDIIVVITIPHTVYGEGIYRGSVIITDNGESLIYTDDGNGNLKIGNDIYGNVFYGSGVVVIYKDVEENVTLYDYDIKFRSTNTIYENEILISLSENDYNISQNPTAVDWNESGVGFVKYDSIVASNDSSVSGGFGDYEKYVDTDPTGSFLSTYITTIGLYDDDNQMVAVAKLPQIVKKMPGHSLNFLIRFDM